MSVEPWELDAAESAVRRGELVVLPTDTVYGVGADAFNPQAVGALLAAKRRGRNMPVPVLVGSWQTIEGLTTTLPVAARDLIHAFWPGGLTLVVRQAPTLAWDLGDNAGTVAVRMPLHPVALDLLARTGPMAVSSANRSGSAPAVTVAAAREQLGGTVSVYLDGGPSEHGEASSMVDLTGPGAPRLLRAGAVTLERLREVVPALLE
jgi:L-threonylcarbamoyladenylate synthase